MKRYFFYIFFISSLFVSCGSQETIFDFNAQTEFRVELGLSIIESHFFVKDNVIIPLELNMNNMGLSNEDVSQVTPQVAFLSPRFSEEINLDFINAVNIFIIDPNNLTRRKELFYLDQVPFGTKKEIELIPTLIDISDLLDNDRAIIEIKLDIRQFPPQSFDMQVDMTFGGFSSE